MVHFLWACVAFVVGVYLGALVVALCCISAVRRK